MAESDCILLLPTSSSGYIKEQLLENNQITSVSSKWAHAKRTEHEDVYRVPYTMSHHLRIALMNNTKYLERDICTGLATGRFHGIVDQCILQSKVLWALRLHYP